jgi:sugar transferase (PEP-CTERM/EpsH1 system associated)
VIFQRNIKIVDYKLVQEKPVLLYLCHRVPYPPNKGDKIRSFNFLKHLSAHYRIHLGCFVDEPDDLLALSELNKYCCEVLAIPINTKWRTIQSISGFISKTALSVAYYGSSKMSRWINSVLVLHSDCRIFVFSSVMAQFVPETHLSRCVIDFVDVDSDKWAQYASRLKFPMSFVYRREAALLLAYDIRYSRRAHKSIFVSKQEAALFLSKDPTLDCRIDHVENGVDTEFFKPNASLEQIEFTDNPSMVFVGAMDYWANIDAVSWFVSDVLPEIQKSIPNIVFYIVGSKPTIKVKSLAGPNIVVTGRVEDVRPYVLLADIVVAPLRIARGVQNKVLEAMACAKEVVCTTNALEGINSPDVVVADTAEQLAQKIMDIFQRGMSRPVNEQNRQFVLDHFSWVKSVEKLVGLIANTPDRRTNTDSASAGLT